ncbi:hypothetical protein A3729_26775 [Oleiphilus sp. HI0043]|nr:hypothetical protein A3729_09585 [Oleiphilus sp. HI0043]KZY38190.1 hypothetical protein A3729_26775 [Oleiphilus sp. HI0043]KZZ69056.1 hypothetical protein A3763_13145 [Oleiphilus sp. HI0128]
MLHAKMTDTEFLLYYNSIVVFIALAIAVWRVKNNWQVIKAQAVEAEIVQVEKDVDVVISINIKIKTRHSLAIEQIHIDPMYDKTDYRVGSPFTVWVHDSNPRLYFRSKPNAFKLIGKIGLQSLAIWVILCGMLMVAFAKKFSM